MRTTVRKRLKRENETPSVSKVLDTCCICLSKVREPSKEDVCNYEVDGNYSIDDVIVCSQCNHYFHEECISQTYRAECPLCRYELDLRREIKEKIEENYKLVHSNVPYRFIRDNFPSFVARIVIAVLENLNDLEDVDTVYYSTYFE